MCCTKVNNVRNSYLNPFIFSNKLINGLDSKKRVFR